MCDKQILTSACAYAQSDQCLCKSLEYSMTVILLTKHHLEFLSFKGGYSGSYESTLVKMPHCWKSHAAAHFRMLVSSHEIYRMPVNYLSAELLNWNIPFNDLD